MKKKLLFVIAGVLLLFIVTNPSADGFAVRHFGVAANLKQRFAIRQSPADFIENFVGVGARASHRVYSYLNFNYLLTGGTAPTVVGSFSKVLVGLSDPLRKVRLRQHAAAVKTQRSKCGLVGLVCRSPTASLVSVS